MNKTEAFFSALGANDVALQMCKAKKIVKMPVLGILIPLKCVVLQVDPGAAWFQDNKPVAKASKVLTPPKEIRVTD